MRVSNLSVLGKVILTGFLLSGNTMIAETLKQIVRGKIVDKATHRPVTGVSLSVNDSGSFTGTTTDSSGFFQFKVPLGRHHLKVSHIAYNNLSLPLLADGGKEVILKIEMTERITGLNEVVISPGYPESKTQEIGKIDFTVEEMLRNAATFNDPSRLIIQYPGIGIVNDQGNNISVHGSSPNAISWRLEGVDIVNPSHLMNGGTFNDRVSRSGGGVNILSSQLMANSSFLTGPFSAEYGNALSGIYDINFRKGNNIRREYTAQVSLYGTDFAAEGPFSKANTGSYLVNYRYSTVALFGLMGITFGGEAIKFQDLSVNLSFPTKNAGTFSVFGMGGLSNNEFITPRDSSSWLYEKDRYDIVFFSNMFATGITHEINLGRKTFLRSVAAISGMESERTGSYLNNQYQPLLKEVDRALEQKRSLSATVSHKLNLKNSVKAGGYFTQLYFNMLTKENLIDNPATTVYGKGYCQLLQPYVNLEHRFSENLVLNTGLHFMYFSLNGSQSLEPRTSLSWIWKKNRSVGLAYGLHSMLQQPQLYFMQVAGTENNGSNPNSALGFTKAHHLSLSYNTGIFKEVKLLSRVFYQRLFNIPIEKNISGSFSAINVLDDWVSRSLINKGTGESYGVDASIEKPLFTKYYFLVSGSLYNAVYKGSDGIQRNTRFNGNYTTALTCGREATVKKRKDRTIGTNLRFIYLGGYRNTPINPDASSLANTTIFIDSQAFSEKAAGFYRIDFRFSVKRNKVNYTRTWAIDIQNLSNQMNIASQYYDVEQKKVSYKYHNGLIPILSYRVDF